MVTDEVAGFCLRHTAVTGNHSRQLWRPQTSATLAVVIIGGQCVFEYRVSCCSLSLLIYPFAVLVILAICTIKEKPLTLVVK